MARETHQTFDKEVPPPFKCPPSVSSNGPRWRESDEMEDMRHNLRKKKSQIAVWYHCDFKSLSLVHFSVSRS